jgi:uncharacterized protein (DUF697 family)
LRRTIVPLAIGLIITTAAKVGFDIDTPEENAVVASLVTAGYYGSFRVLERFFPTAGVAIGGVGAPSYVKDNGERGGDDHHDVAA